MRAFGCSALPETPVSEQPDLIRPPSEPRTCDARQWRSWLVALKTRLTTRAWPCHRLQPNYSHTDSSSSLKDIAHNNISVSATMNYNKALLAHKTPTCTIYFTAGLIFCDSDCNINQPLWCPSTWTVYLTCKQRELAGRLVPAARRTANVLESFPQAFRPRAEE